MKKIIITLMAFVAVSLASTNVSAQNCCDEHEHHHATEQADKVQTITPEQLAKDGAKYKNKKVIISGTVDHICKHGGMKCFIIGKDGETSTQVMSTKKVGPFAQELIGKTITINGVVREHRIKAENIAKNIAAIEMEMQKTGKKDDEYKNCTNSLEKMNKMQAWIDNNKTDYYPVYFIKCDSYKK